MALEPCQVCGTLNSTEAEICLSCEFPTKGRRRPAIFQWAAIGLFVLFTIPLIWTVMNQLKSKPQNPSPHSVSFHQSLREARCFSTGRDRRGRDRRATDRE